MAQPIAISLGSLNLGTAPYVPQEPLQWGSDAVQAALLTGDYKPEEMDEAVQALGLVRQVTIPMSIRSGDADAAITDQQAITTLLGAANRYTPMTMSVTPTNSTRVSTFKVWGGSWSADYTNYSSLSNVTDGTLNLQCDPFIYGTPQILGSAGTPLTAGTVTSPASFAVTPTILGDVPAEIQLFIRNTSGHSIRSALVSTVPGNTTWNFVVNSTSMTPTLGSAVADAAAKNATVVQYGDNTPSQNSVVTVASWSPPSPLPTDRPFRVFLRIRDRPQDGGTSFRLRHVSGSVEVVGEWRTLSPSAVGNQYSGADMGAMYFPVSGVSAQGASTTTTFFEVVCRNSTSNININVDYALYLPDDSTMLFETSDESKLLIASAGTAIVESDSVYSSTGQGAGGADVGSHIRSLGASSYVVHTSQGYMGTLGTTSWGFETYTAWAKVTPRMFNLA